MNFEKQNTKALATKRLTTKRRLRAALTVLLLGSAVAGCEHVGMQRLADEEAYVYVGAPVRANRTPLEGAFACMARAVNAHNDAEGIAPVGIGVGDVKDYTGKYSQNEGSTITQGGPLMIYSALGKLDGAVQMQERFDTRIAELELAYIDRRQLGDGSVHNVDGAAVPWMPYFGGTIMRSDYYIVGGITEINYNIQSGGAEFRFSGIGPQARVYTLNVGIDLRIVDSQTLLVAKTVSLQKQLTGVEVGFNIFRFFGDDLYDVNIGNKSQEPMQLAVRTSLEQGVIELVSSVTGVDHRPCMASVGRFIPEYTAEEFLEMDPGVDPVVGPTAPAAPGPGAPPPAPPPPVRNFVVFFDFNESTLSNEAREVVSQAVAEARRSGSAEVDITGHTDTVGSQVYNQELSEERANMVKAEMVRLGIPAGDITTMGAGFSQLLIQTGPGVQEPQNRRAVIDVAPGATAAAPPAATTPQPIAAGANISSGAPLQGGAAPAVAVQIAFEPGATHVSAMAGTAIMRIAELATAGQVIEITLVARETEVLAPALRQEVTNQRIRAVTDALAGRGIASGRVAVVWRPAPSDVSIRRDGGGYQEIAKLRINRP